MARREQRAARFSRLDEAKAGVRSVCLEHVLKRRNSPWSTGEQSYLDAEIKRWSGSPKERKALQVAAALRQAADDAFRLLDADAAKAGPALRALANLSPELVVIWNRLPQLEPGPEYNVRQSVVNTEMPDAWWWRGEPTSRDLAVLALLAGSWPENTDWRSKTAAEIIATEERAVTELRRKYGSSAWRGRTVKRRHRRK